jgi:hypothetical protein
LFALVDSEFAGPTESDGMRQTVERAGAALVSSDRAAAEHSIDFPKGAGA